MIKATAMTDANSKGHMGQPDASMIANTRYHSPVRKHEL
jgi:hypothetical protein